MLLHAARQPILDREQNIYAYELLFRDENQNATTDGDIATSRLISMSQFESSLKNLASEKPAHINFNLASILKKYPQMMSAEEAVIEIVDIEKPDLQLLRECRTLYRAGYSIVIDGYTHHLDWQDFIPFVTMLKIDTLSASTIDIHQAVRIKQQHPHIKLAAKNIEDEKAFQLTHKAGFDYFQGYYIACPQYICKRSIADSNYSLSELLFELSKKKPNLANIIAIFEADVSLSYKLLRYSNCAIFIKPEKTTSIRQAVVDLGKEQLLKFVTLLLNTQCQSSEYSKLMAASLLRAKMCEGLSLLSYRNLDPAMAFLMGMLSMFDMILEEEFSLILNNLELAPQIQSALIDNSGDLACILAMVKCYEVANWDQLNELSEQLQINPSAIAKTYQLSAKWTDQKINCIAN